MKKLFTIALLFCGALTSLHATVLSGTFTLDGTVVITNTGLIEWISNTSVANQATISAGHADRHVRRHRQPDGRHPHVE